MNAPDGRDSMSISSVPGGPAPASEASPPDPRRWFVLALAGLAQLMIVLDLTIMNIALPTAQTALHFSNVDRQWVITAYALAFGSLLLFGGRLGDLIGRKVTFLVGLLGFAGASAVGGAATSFTMLVGARASQGAFGALLAPAALSLLTTTFSDPRERGKAFGVYGAIAGGGGAVGLVLGGLLTEYLSWRWCLYVNLFFAGIAATGGLLLLSRQPRGGQRPRLDLPGVAMVSASMFGLAYGFSNAATHSWHTPSTWGFLAAGVALLVIFVAWQARAAHPLLPLRVVLDRNRGGAYLAVLVSGAGMFGIFLFLTYYLQQTLHYSPVVNGVAFLPMIGMIVVSANLANNALLPRVGPKPLVALGMLLAAGSMVWLTRIGLHSSYPHAVLGPLLVAGLAFGFIIAPSMNTGTFGVAPQDAGVASAVLNTGQQIGGSIGTSLLNTLAASATASYRAAHLTRGTLVNGRPSTQAVSLSLIHGYTTAFWWAAAIFAAGAVICGLLLRRGPLGPAGSGTVSPAAAGTVSPAAAGTVSPAAAGTVAAGTVREGSPLMGDSENGALAPGDTTPGGTTDAPDGASYAPYLGPPPGGDGGRAGGQPVHGWVRQPDGAPIGGATVTLIDPAGRQAGHGRTGPDGSYQIPAPRQGTYTLIAIAGAHQPHASAVQVGSQPVELQVLLAGASRLTGTVRTAGSGSPLAAATVTLADARGDVVAARTTDDAGSYSFEETVPGSYSLAVSAPSFRPVALPVTVAAATDTTQDAELVAAGRLAGTVLTGGGSAVAGARVTLLDGEGSTVATMTTGPDGGYAFEDLPEGEYTVLASGYPPVASQLSIAAGRQHTHDVRLGYPDA